MLKEFGSELQSAMECVDERSTSTVIRVISFVVQDKFIIDEIKRIRPCLERVRNHLVDEIGWQRRKLVDVLASVLRVGNAVAEVEVERFQQVVFEIVALNHSEILHVFAANLELHAGRIKTKNYENCETKRKIINDIAIERMLRKFHHPIR